MCERGLRKLVCMPIGQADHRLAGACDSYLCDGVKPFCKRQRDPVAWRELRLEAALVYHADRLGLEAVLPFHR
jgi:hypothetical protein